MRDLFRFLFRHRNNMLFLALMALSMALLVNGNMHQRAQAISSSNAVVGQLFAWRSEVAGYASLRKVNHQLAVALAQARDARYQTPLRKDTVQVVQDTLRLQTYAFITAQVINGTVHKERNYITLSSGSLAGIAPDMGVIGMNGLVGIVRDVSPHFALVTSILGNEYRTSIQLKRTGHYGLLAWDTGTPSTASMTDVANHVPVQVGDTVVTRGNDGIFPPGIPVGTVAAVNEDPGSNFHDIKLHLGEDLGRTAYVHVIIDLLKAERDTLETKAVRP
ncbi:MAG: rod shape-determining protein MreC [Flavobacteriales bacterium]|nr:rod shape-determining protein MreC [Flavobacteriales bacterium]MBP9079160.1 rod shape-determining protein MreC [Flavobacteriales bacterium]